MHAFDQLRTAARPALQQWIDAHASDVKKIMDAALRPAAPLHKLTSMQTSSSAPSSLPTPLGPLLSWLKSRAKKGKGGFDPALFAMAIPYLGDGWKIAQTTGLLPITDNSASVLSQVQRDVKIKPPRSTSDYYSDNVSWWALAPEAADLLRFAIMPANSHGLPLVERPEVGVIYTTAPTKVGQHRGFGPPLLWVKAPALGVAAWTVRAPSGKAFLVLDRPRWPGDPLPADAFWKWAYAEGLDVAAKAAIPTEDQQAAAERAAAVAKGRGTCGVCFGLFAVHKRHGMVQHGYLMSGGGWGHGHQGMFKQGGDCFGVSMPPFEVSPRATQTYSERLADFAAQAAEAADKWESGEFDDQPIYVLIRQSWRGVEVSDAGPHATPARGEELVKITKGHHMWESRVALRVQELRKRAVELRAQSEAYAKAAANWPEYPKGVQHARS